MATRKKKTNALNKLLDKAGIEKIEDLQPEERATYEHYKLVLTKEVTVETIQEFCQAQIKVIEGKCDGVNPITTLQQACIHVYTNLLKMIETTEKERESLEMMLNQMANATPTV